MLDRLDDTIVALSSAPGYGAVGIIRLSGPQAISIVARMARTAGANELADQPGSTRVFGDVLIDEETGLPAHFYLFRSPHSYTRQDLVEIHTVGSPAALEAVHRCAIVLGARAAHPGEFTARAFLNGAMDLVEAEAVAGVIQAQTDTQLRAARRIREGAFSRMVHDLRAELTELLALVEADIDFCEEPIDFIAPEALHRRIGKVLDCLRQIIASSTPMERLEVLPHVLLIGPPNVGKSSLMNRLSGTNRAICAAAAGTTRDVLSAPVQLGSVDAILLDTAGMDRSIDEVAAKARNMTISTAEQVDLLCAVLEVTAPLDEHVFDLLRSLAPVRTVLAVNKCDLVTLTQAARQHRRLQDQGLGPVCLVSALKGTGLDDLRTALAEGLAGSSSTTSGEVLFLTERQREALDTGAETLQRAASISANAHETIDCADILAFELREALDALGTIAGVVPTEELLAHVFANFCIGK
ncbi:MAG: tRNA modification GTPase [Phycisphaerales bacterium]|nr:MAG: tRNA modification GTPase [Phycisphaerales bacterium]